MEDADPGRPPRATGGLQQGVEPRCQREHGERHGQRDQSVDYRCSWHNPHICTVRTAATPVKAVPN
jgi:hypothetical protein